MNNLLIPPSQEGPPLITTHAVINFSLYLLLFSLLPPCSILPSTTRLILLKYLFSHVILWLRSISCLLAGQNFLQAHSLHILGLSFHDLSLSTAPLTLFPMTKTSCNDLHNVPFILFL